MRAGDILVVTSLDRLARSTLHLCQIADEQKRKEVELQVLDRNIDTADVNGLLLFNILGAINEFETEIRAERQTDGINKAKQNGVRCGTAKKLNGAEIEEMREKRKSGVLIKNMMVAYKLSKATVYRYLGNNLEKVDV